MIWKKYFRFWWSVASLLSAPLSLGHPVHVLVGEQGQGCFRVLEAVYTPSELLSLSMCGGVNACMRKCRSWWGLSANWTSSNTNIHFLQWHRHGTFHRVIFTPPLHVNLPPEAVCLRTVCRFTSVTSLISLWPFPADLAEPSLQQWILSFPLETRGNLLSGSNLRCGQRCPMRARGSAAGQSAHQKQKWVNQLQLLPQLLPHVSFCHCAHCGESGALRCWYNLLPL